MIRMTTTHERLRRTFSPKPFAYVLREPARRQRAGVALRPAERAWIATLAALGVAATLVALARANAPTAEHVILGLAFGALVAVAWLFPVPFAFKTDLCLDLSVLLAATLLFDPLLAILLAAGGTALAHLIRRKGPAEALFNTAQVALQVAVGSAILATAGWNPGELDIDRAGAVAVIALAALATIALTDVTVAVMVAAQSGMNPGPTWLTAIRQTGRGDATTQAAQIGLGTAAAILVHASPWMLGLLLLPAAAVHMSLATAQRERRRAAEALRNTEAALAEAERIATSEVGSGTWRPGASVGPRRPTGFLVSRPPRSFRPGRRSSNQSIPTIGRRSTARSVRRWRGAARSFSNTVSGGRKDVSGRSTRTARCCARRAGRNGGWLRRCKT